MITFIIGLVILFVGAALYGRFCEKVFGPDDRKTLAYTKQDGIDYVPMKKWKNSLINLLNIAGTGPILGPIQGILFGPHCLYYDSYRKYYRRSYARLLFRYDLSAGRVEHRCRI